MKTKIIITSIADVEVEYHYTYTPGIAPHVNCRIEDSDPGSGADISLEGPYIGDTDIGAILDMLPKSARKQIEDSVYEAIELREADSAEDARHAADDDRYERLRDERDGL